MRHDIYVKLKKIASVRIRLDAYLLFIQQAVFFCAIMFTLNYFFTFLLYFYQFSYFLFCFPLLHFCCCNCKLTKTDHVKIFINQMPSYGVIGQDYIYPPFIHQGHGYIPCNWRRIHCGKYCIQRDVPERTHF